MPFRAEKCLMQCLVLFLSYSAEKSKIVYKVIRCKNYNSQFINHSIILLNTFSASLSFFKLLSPSQNENAHFFIFIHASLTPVPQKEGCISLSPNEKSGPLIIRERWMRVLGMNANKALPRQLIARGLWLLFPNSVGSFVNDTYVPKLPWGLSMLVICALGTKFFPLCITIRTPPPIALN